MASAPDIAGRGVANPIAAIWSGVMLLDFLGERQAAGLVLDAVKEVTGEGRVLTPDLGGHARTSEVGDEVVARLRSLAAHLYSRQPHRYVATD